MDFHGFAFCASVQRISGYDVFGMLLYFPGNLYLSGKRKLLERERLSGLMATDYLEATAKVRERQPLSCPMQSVPYAKYVDFRYGKVLDSTTQRPRFLNEQDWAGEKIKNKCKTYKI